MCVCTCVPVHYGILEYISFLLSCNSKSVHVQVLSANLHLSYVLNKCEPKINHPLYVHVPLGPAVSTLLQEQGKIKSI